MGTKSDPGQVVLRKVRVMPLNGVCFQVVLHVCLLFALGVS